MPVPSPQCPRATVQAALTQYRQGEVEVDESTGLQQVQIAVPVLDGGKPIGSLVVGLSLTKMKN